MYYFGLESFQQNIQILGGIYETSDESPGFQC